MKSIFKKVALVMALAMVVTMLPAKTVSAARADGSENQYVRKSCMLYLDGDATETYGAQAWATRKAKSDAWKTNGYTVTFTSEDESIATVGARKGQITAVSVGETNIVATFSKEGAEDIVEIIPVTVKRNAVDIKLDDASQEAIKSLTVGSEVTLKGVPTDADGNEGEQYVSDYIKFKVENPEDKEVLTVDPKTGELKAVAAGKATVKVYTHQYEYSTETKGYKISYTATKPYDVEVEAAEIDVQQTAWNAFSITFADAASAEAAVNATLPSLSVADAPVSEDKSVVKVYEVIQAATANTSEAEQEIFIKNISNTGNVVTVTLFNELKEETSFKVRYQDYTKEFKTCKYVAVDFAVNNWVVARTEYSIEKAIDYVLYATGVNGQYVDITGCEAYGKGDWKNSVTLEDLATDYSSNYVFSDKSVWFYTTVSTFVVTLKATFEDWYVVENNNARKFEKTVQITPGDTSIVTGTLQEWGIVKVWDGNGYDNKLLAVGDENYRLAVTASIKEYGEDKFVSTDKDNLETDRFTFVSSNDDKLSVNEKTGEIYPPKSAVGHVLVHVFYDETYVGFCDVEVVAKRRFDSLYTDASVIRLAYGKGNLHESKSVKVFTNDQLNAHYEGNGEGTVTLSIALADAQYDGWLTVDGVSLTKEPSVPVPPYVVSGGEPSFNFQVTSKAEATAKTIRVIVTGVYESTDQKVRIEKKTSFNITVKNTSGVPVTDYRSYSLEASTNTMDEILYKPRTDNTTIAHKKVTLSAYALDKEGFKIEQLDLSNSITNVNSGQNIGENSIAVLIKKGSETQNDVGADKLGFTTSGSDIVFTTVAVDSATVSGSATTTGSAIGGEVKKIATGSYSVNLFIGNQDGVATYKAGSVISVIDSQDYPTFKWVENQIDASVSDKIDIATKAMDLFFDVNRNGSIDWNEYGDHIEGNIIAADVVVKGDRATIKSITYKWIFNDDDKNYFLFKVDINRTVVIK